MATPCRENAAGGFRHGRALVAASPDMDVFFTRTPLQYIEYHRGITHSFVGGLGLALLLALIPWLMNRWRVPKVPDDSPPFGWPLPLAWLTAYLLILHHIFLDCMNSYGTQVFLPFSDYRVRLNALFIVDPLLLLPLALGLIFWRKRRAVMIGLLLWTILYPLGSLATRVGLEAHLKDSHYTPDVFTQELLSEDLAPGQRGKGLWDDVRAVHLVPDAFTPFHWKLILDRGSVWDVAGYTVFTEEPQTFIAYAKPPQPLWAELAAKDRMFRAYERFALYPALEAEIPLEGPLEGYTEYVFSDLRFGSTIGWVDDIQVRRHGKPTTFRIMAASPRMAGSPQSASLPPPARAETAAGIRLWSEKRKRKIGRGERKASWRRVFLPLFSPSQGFFTKWGGKAEGSSSVFQSAATRKRVVACFGRFAPLID